MELKKYQKQVIVDLNDYLAFLKSTNSLRMLIGSSGQDVVSKLAARNTWLSQRCSECSACLLQGAYWRR